MIKEIIEWESRVLQELYKDYAYVMRERHLKIRPAAITLTDSDSFWAQWNPLTRTILMSRKLIRNHNWFQVVSILKHEMAHQLLDESEELSRFTATPHGDAFYSACQRLGVPEEYSRASVCLQTATLDWREEKRDEVSEKMLEKVRKLLSLATSSNEHESLLAMNKVRAIYAKYHLEEVAQRPSFAHVTITHGKKRVESHQSRIISILVEHFFVQVISTKMFDPASGTYHAAFDLMGSRENVMMAEYVYYFLLQQAHLHVTEVIKKTKISRLQRKSYKLGLLFGFSEKLAETTKANSKSSKSSTSASDTDVALIAKALAVFRKDPALESYVSKIYPRLHTKSAGSQYIDNSVFSQGRSVGRTIILNKPVNTASEKLGRLLK